MDDDLKTIFNLLGTEVYTDLLARLPDAFYHLPETTREAFWKAVLQWVLEGVMDLGKLIRRADTWLAMYQVIKEALPPKLVRS